MAGKRTVEWVAFDAVDASTNQTSDVTNVAQNSDSISIHCVFDGNVDGEFKVEAANFVPSNGLVADYDWYELDFNQTLTLTAQSECQILLNSTPFQALRLLWIPSSAVGRTLTAYYFSKTVGL